MRASRLGAEKDAMRWIAPAALFAPLVVLLLVAANTWKTERQYAAVTHKVTRDYAGIAAWQYARRANTVLHDEAMHAFSGILSGHQREAATGPALSPSTILSAQPAHSSVFLQNARFAAVYDAATDRLDIAGEGIGNDDQRAIAKLLRTSIQNGSRDGDPHRVIFRSISSGNIAVAIWTRGSADAPVRTAYAVAIDDVHLRKLFEGVVDNAGLFPGARAAETADKNGVALELTRRDGAIVFASPAEPGATAAVDSTTLQSGELRVTVDLLPSLMNSLLVGGAPSSQLPSLALMILVSVAFAVLGLIHQRRTRELARIRSRFVANVSHELRTPLTQISMFAETLARDRQRTAEEGRHFASIILAESRRLTALVERVLGFSRLEARSGSLQLEPLSIADEIAEIAETFSPVAEASGVDLKTELDETIVISADRGAFHQVLLNLLDNAAKHGGRGTSILVSTRQADANLIITVDDTGPGIPREWRDRVFEPYVRAEQSHVAGAGIGLSVVSDLVAAHGGSVSIEDAPGGGARFTVVLPGARRASHQMARESAAATVG
jgi:signal transduction histidine kinase